MTDEELGQKKLAVIERCLTERRELAHPERLVSDVREERFVLHTLQIAIQAALDVASHIVSDAHLGEPRTNRELFERLTRAGRLPEPLGARPGAMAGFRNLLVHGYDEVDLAIVRDVVEHHLGDLDAFVVSVRAQLGA